ncbi:MAG: hydroxymethylbilane synthase, partial [Vicinamibacteria bacterium]|jgi:hydroxymethylbilane synthase|nr:hydroxymethylbilane synthase [Vicinamibacteria bacterium]
LTRAGARLLDLRQGARVGTTSLRRQAQLRALRPDLDLVDLRGNVDTRIRRLRAGDFDAILLAMAGLVRLERAHEVSEALDPAVMLPAPGQGVIAIECRERDARVADCARQLNHPVTERTVAAERAFLRELGGGCNIPVGAHAVSVSDGVHLRALVARSDGSQILRFEGRGSAAEDLGRQAARDLIQRGARELLV